MKATGARIRRFVLRLILYSLVAFLAGCETAYDWSLTYQLWDNESLSKFNEPAPDPRVRLFLDERHKDVLVEYDEIRDRDGSVHRRAFFVRTNLDRLRAGRPPRFVDLETATGLKPIALLRAQAGERVPAEGLCIRISESQKEFTLYSDGEVVRGLQLPTYPTSKGRVKKTLLTPLTVTGDALIVSTVVGVAAASVLAESGCSFSVHH